MNGLAALSIICLLSAAPAAAAEELSFTDVTHLAGTGGPTEPGRLGGHGAMFTDVNGDARPDLYITMIFDDPMPDLLYLNLDGLRFADEGQSRGIADFDGGSHGANFADLDNDGDFDLFNGATWEHPDYPSFNNVYRNDGGRFLDVTAQCGIPSECRLPTRGVLTFDMDRDGDLDLFCVSNFQGSADPANEPNEVYHNLGQLCFQAVEGALSTAPCGQGATDTDFDGDGDIDVIAANRTGPVNVLRNDGQGAFSPVDPGSLGLRHRAGDGITAADVDNDGDLDLLLASDDVGHLYRNDGDGQFTSWQDFADTDGYMGGFADLDNDGDLDLVFAGDAVCYLNDGLGCFRPGPPIPVHGINDPRAIAFADIDDDGDLDFAVACKRSTNRLFRNELTGGNWLKVRLVSPQGQAGAFGAKARIYDSNQNGERLLGMREARSNAGYLSQDDPVLHFGLGAKAHVDVVVTFLDSTTAERASVPANQTITIDASQP